MCQRLESAWRPKKSRKNAHLSLLLSEKEAGVLPRHLDEDRVTGNSTLAPFSVLAERAERRMWHRSKWGMCFLERCLIRNVLPWWMQNTDCCEEYWIQLGY
jgi:hypothetical protein